MRALWGFSLIFIHINCNIYKWKYDILYDLYDSISINQCIIYINTKNTLINLVDRLVGEIFRTISKLNPYNFTHGNLILNNIQFTTRNGEKFFKIFPRITEHFVSSFNMFYNSKIFIF